MSLLGEVAEMILEGVLCQYCGVVLDDIVAGEEASGYPRVCEDCEEDK